MERIKSLKLNWKGFTLIELLIVVAIIGILAASGTPMYRRMMQKARKGEAQVLLGNTATAEAAFFAEYGGYGNNITKMGAEMDANNNNLTYAGGFPASTACAQATISGTGFPADVSFAIGATTLSSPTSFSGYNGVTSVSWNGTTYQSVTSMMGRLSLASCSQTGQALSGSSFKALAQGYIGNQFPNGRDNCNGGTSGANCDIWSIDQGRTLSNVTDGVGK